jgi:hypothetical protein
LAFEALKEQVQNLTLEENPEQMSRITSFDKSFKPLA